MPRKNDLRVEEVAGNGLIAAGQSLTSFTQNVVPRSQANKWQDELWGYYDNVGEFEFVANWTSAMISKARLRIMKNGIEVTTGPAKEALDELFGSDIGKQDGLAALGLHHTVAGEAYIIADKMGEWDVHSPQSVSKASGKWAVDGEEVETAFVMRSWRRHPRRPKEATSSARSAIPILAEIYRTTQHVEAQLVSRLISGGLLLIPNEMAFSAASDTKEGAVANQSNAQAFIKEFIRVATTAIANRSAASAVVPMVMTADGEHLDKPRLLEFWSSLDEKVLETRAKAIARLGLALDVPPEILTGTGDVSHWQAWGVDESAIKSHAEPLLKRITADLTRGYLWPALKGIVSDEELKTLRIDADTTDLRVRPNRSKEAIELYNSGELKASTMRSENGFTEQDAPDDAERKSWLQKKAALAAIDSTMSWGAMSELGVDLPAPAGSVGNGQQPDPSLEGHPDRASVPSDGEMDDLMRDAERKQRNAALLAGCEQMVFRALERAGAKARSQLNFMPPGNVQPAEFYLMRENSDAEASFMLSNAFAHVDRFASGWGCHPTLLSEVLEAYCRDLIVNRRPHNPTALAEALSAMNSVAV